MEGRVEVMSKALVFQDLTRDHHVFLLHAKRLRQAAGVGGPTASVAARAFLEYWNGSVLSHLAEEEHCILPVAIDQAVAGRIRVGCDKLRHQADWLRVALMEMSLLRSAMEDLSDAIRAHVRLTEWEMFANMVESMGQKRADWIQEKLNQMRKANRPYAMGEGYADETYL